MAYQKSHRDMEAAWDAVSKKWFAEIKSKYASRIFLALLSEAAGMYQRNEDLKRYAKQCTSERHE